MNLLFAAEQLSSVQLLIAGLVSGSGILALVVKYLLSAPEREASAYKQGAIDERSYNKEQIESLKAINKAQEAELISLRNNLLRLAVATDLTAAQKREIANMLGFKSTIAMIVEAEITPE
jgi:hypothetical protein